MLPYAVAMAGLCALLLFAVHAERKALEWVVKPLAALTFVAAAWRAGALSSTYGTVMLLGLALAAAGDVLLIPKDRRAFLGGLVSFLLGHVAYAVAFALRGLDLAWTALAAAALAAAAVPILRWLWPHVEPRMKGPVAAYVVVITAMVALAVGDFAARGNLAVVVGAVGFYLSDLSVARERFVQPGFVNRAWGLPLYFAAQLVLASTVGDP